VPEAATICPRPCTLTFDLLTLKVVSESRGTWVTSVPILVSLGLSVLDLGSMYATDRRQTDRQRERQTSDAHHLCSGLRPNVRQTSDRRQTVSSLYAPPIRGGGIIIPLFSAGLGLGTCGLVNTTVLS